MIDLWLVAGLLLLAALAFILVPVLRGQRAQAEEDRTALNVALYEERVRELEAQHAAGTLTAEQLAAGKAEAARELLVDTEGDTQRHGNLGRAVPIAAAVLVPVLGLALYLYWGASDKLELARQFDHQPASMEEMVTRLEQAVKAQPDGVEGWYFLARGYMAMERPAEAATAFERTVALAGRDPSLLGQWAQALYFANGQQWNAQIQGLTDEALQGDPGEVTSRGLLGIVAFEDGRYRDAIDHWEFLMNGLDPQDPNRMAIQQGIQRAREMLGEDAPAASASVAPAQMRVRVELAPNVIAQVRPEDSVFVFARPAAGGAMPLAVKRLTVADLPAEVLLSDADAMMEQLRLSNFPQVELVARVSRGGNATAGEWIGRSGAVSSADDQLKTLRIDQPEKR